MLRKLVGTVVPYAINPPTRGVDKIKIRLGISESSLISSKLEINYVEQIKRQRSKMSSFI